MMTKKRVTVFTGVTALGLSIGLATPMLASGSEGTDKAEITNELAELPVIQKAEEPFIHDGSTVMEE